MQESRRNHILYHAREMLKHNKIQTSRVTWGTQVLIEMTNWCIMCLILRCLIRTHCFFSPSPGWTYAKIFRLCRFAVCQQLHRTKLRLELTMTSASLSIFFLFFSRAPLQRPVWSKQSEREKGREAEAGKEKNERKLPNEQKNAQTGLSTQTKAAHHKFSHSLFSSEQNFCQTDSTSQLTQSLCHFFQFQTPKLECII